MFSLIYICLDLHEKFLVFSINLYVLIVQYFYQWLHYDNL